MSGVKIEIDEKIEAQVLAILEKHGLLKPASMTPADAEKIMWSEIKRGKESGDKNGWTPINSVWSNLGVK